MTENGVQYGDRVQAGYVEIYGMDDPVCVWVVVAGSGLVVSIAEPPIGVTLPGGPCPVDSVSEDAQGPREPGSGRRTRSPRH